MNGKVRRISARASLFLFAAISLAIASVVFALYWQVLGVSPMFDDVPYFAGHHTSIYGGSFSPFTPRYWPHATLAFQRTLFGDDLVPLRAANVALHLLTGGALFLFLRALLDLPLKGGRMTMTTQRTATRTAAIWLAVLCFLLHPVAVYGVAYLVQRTIVMATLFCLLMWWAFLRGLTSGRTRWFFLACLFCQLALYSKQHSVMAPAVAALLFTRFPRNVWLRPAPLLTLAVCCGLSVSVMLKVRYAIGTVYQEWVVQGLAPASVQVEHPHLTSILTQSSLFFKYLSLWLVPLTSQMAIDISEPLLDIYRVSSWAWGTLFVAWCAGGVWLALRKGRAGLVGIALLTPALLFATELSTARITETFVLYRSYLWAPSLFLLIPLLAGLIDWRIWLAGGLLAASLLFWLASGRLHTLESPIALWSDVIRLADARGHTTLRDRAYCNRGMAYLELKRFDQAMADFEQARRWNPSQPLAYLGRGLVFLRTNQVKQAVTDFDEALRLKPGWPQALFFRADALRKNGDIAAADDDLRHACEKGVGLACYTIQKIRESQDAYIPAQPRDH